LSLTVKANLRGQTDNARATASSILVWSEKIFDFRSSSRFNLLRSYAIERQKTEFTAMTRKRG
jgi:hypothetical protein